MRWDRYGQLKPHGPRDWYAARSEKFARQCPFSPAADDEDRIASERFPRAGRRDEALGRFEKAYVGHVAEDGWRAEGSSGGLVSWVAADLLRSGSIDGVAHVKPTDPAGNGRLFDYRISRSVAGVRKGAKSRYYPVELSRVIDEMRRVPGRYAVVGVPCFIKAVHLLRRIDPVLHERIVHTLGLFCGHMKSARMVDSFAWQLGAEPDQVRALDYRVKDPSRPANWYRARLELAGGGSPAQDWWHLADGDWGAGFFQNSACNSCDDVTAETADISFGDAWVEPYSSDGRGTNVVVVRDPSLRAMLDRAIEEGRLQLEEVDGGFVAATQAAGLRHRRQGLSYRLSWMRPGRVPPRKRVPARRGGLPLRRRLVFRMRAAISRWSHRMMWLARALHWPALYLGWAHASLRIYQALAWSHGRLGRWLDRVLPTA